MQTDKKFKHTQRFQWAADGHSLNLYINGYLNVPVRSDKFKDYIAAGLEAIAERLRGEAAEERGVYLRSIAEPEAIPEAMRLTEEKEISKDVRADERQSA